MPEETFSSIMGNPHFNQFVTLLSVPFSSWQWRNNHPKVAFWTLLEPLKKAVFVESSLWPQYRQRAFHALVDILVALVEADDRLRYSQENMDWLVKTLDENRGQVTLAMLLATATSKPSYLTPVQIAEATGTSESNWRNKAASGEIMGAFKAGKQWLLPVTSLRAYGVRVDISGEAIDEDSEEGDLNGA